MRPETAITTVTIEPDAPLGDRSMLVLQYGMAVAAVIGAILLASVR